MSESSEKTRFNAIPTRYSGILFRSRLEARYAVLFDGIRLQWEYEPEGFRLNDGRRYLPDFYFKQIRFWAEVKPDFHSFDSENKAASFVTSTGFHALFFDGPPACKPYFGLHKFQREADPVQYSLDVITFERAFQEGRLWSQPTFDPESTPIENYSESYRAAVDAALSERF